MKLHRTRALLPVAVALATFAGCSNPVDTSENVLPYRSRADTAGADATDVVDGDVAGPACDCLVVGQWFRFNSLGLIDLDGWDHPVVGILNSLWAGDIAKGEINILLEVTAVGADTVAMNVVNGKLVDGSTDVCRDPTSGASMVFPRRGCALLATAETSFDVYAGTEDYPKNCALNLPVQHVIPVSRAVLSGTLSASCDAITNGQVPGGVLGQAEISHTCTCIITNPEDGPDVCGALDASYVDSQTSGACDGCNPKYKSLSALLYQLGGNEDLSWSCTTAADTPATCLTATWSASRLDASPPVCGL